MKSLIITLAAMSAANAMASGPIQEGHVAIKTVSAYALSKTLEVASVQKPEGCTIESSLNTERSPNEIKVYMKGVSRDILATVIENGSVVYTFPYKRNPNDPAFFNRWAYKMTFTDTGTDIAGQKLTTLYDQDGKTIIQVRVTYQNPETGAALEEMECTHPRYALRLKN